MGPGTSARRLALGALTIVAACGHAGGPLETQKPPVDTTSRPLVTLRQAADTRGLRIGTAVNAPFFNSDADAAQYRTILSREFSELTPENDMKHERLQPQQGVFSFGPADSLVAFAEAKGMQVRGHTLVWHNQIARWLTSGTWTQQQASDLMVQHITTVMGHFKGHVVAWDVVNEAFNDDGTRRTSFYSINVGPDYIDKAFRAARAADPTVPLYYNDYNIEGVNAKSDAVYAMAADMKARGVPIDGIGFQGHFQVGNLPAKQSIADNIARFAALGLKVQFTEADVRLPQPSTPDQKNTQGQNYRDLVDVCVQSSACQMFVIWGITDKYSWIPSTFPGWGEALLYDAGYYAKPAYYTVLNYLLNK